MGKLVWGCAVIGILLLSCGGGDGDDDGAGGQTQGNATSASGQSQASGTIDACTLVTKQEAEALLGGPVGDIQKDPVGPFQSCGYYSTAGIFNFVQVQACRCLSGSQFDASTKAGADTLGIPTKPVSGLGDKAYWFGGILWVQKGNYAINLWISTSELTRDANGALEGDALERKALPTHIEVAKKALARLP